MREFQQDVLSGLKAKMTAEELETYNNNAEEVKGIIVSTSNPTAASQLGGEVTMALLGAESMGIITLDDVSKILSVAILVMKGIVMAEKYLPKSEAPIVPPVDLSVAN